MTVRPSSHAVALMLAIGAAARVAPTERPRTSDRARGAASVEVRTFQFAPDTLRVKVGTRVS